MSRGKILVTPRSLSRDMHPALQPLCDAGYELLMPWPGVQPDEQQLMEMLPQCVGYLAGVEKVSRSVLEASPNLKVISRNGVGMDAVDLDSAERLGIKVLGTPGANAQGVAELTIALMLSSIRSLAWSCSRMKQGAWERRLGRELGGSVIGVVGCGQIGQRTSRLALGLGMTVLAYDVCRDPSAASLEGFSFTDMDTLLKEADAVALHCPPSSSPVIDRDALRKMKQGACLINTARAELVDHQALLEALESGKISHYAADVFEQEPPELTELLLHDRVTITPHIGGYTTQSVERAAAAAVENMLKVLEG